MKKWMNYIKEYHKDTAVYRMFSLTNEHALVKAMNDIVSYAKEKDIVGQGCNPVYSEDDARRFLSGYPDDFYNNEELLAECFEDNICKDMSERPLRTTNQNTFPEELQQAFLKAFEEYENVDNGLIKFRIAVCSPGDIIMTHYDSPGEWTPAIPYSKSHLETRIMVFMDDWKDGQVVQIGNDIIKWKKYDAIERTLKHCLHGAANFGFDDRICFQISWIKKED